MTKEDKELEMAAIEFNKYDKGLVLCGTNLVAYDQYVAFKAGAAWREANPKGDEPTKAKSEPSGENT